MKYLNYLLVIALISGMAELPAGTSNWDMSGYRAQAGLTAEHGDDILTITWQGDPENTVRILFAIQDSTPVIRELDIKTANGAWQKLASNMRPEFRVVSGLRRVTRQQTEPLEQMGVPLTAEKLNEIKWDAFWDAPLYLTDEPPRSHLNSIPAPEPFANHPGMPRKSNEVMRATATYQVYQCSVRTNGARLEIIFPGVSAGIFSGYLRYDIYKGSNLIRQMLVAKTSHLSAAFKYDAGLNDLSITENTQMVWRDLTNRGQSYRFGGKSSDQPVIVKSSNRLIAAELENGALAAFPPPHTFYWARESEQNLGYSWYRKDSENSFSFGIRQAEHEEDPQYYHNFALYSARPGTWQRMPVFLYISPHQAGPAIKAALAFTHGDYFKPLPGYKVYAHHYHVGLIKRLKQHGGLHQRLNDIETIRGIGVDIFGVIDGVRGPARHDRGEAYIDALAEYYQAARYQSDRGFLLMPADENSTGGRPPFMGGHYDILPSKPVYWRPGRSKDKPLSEPHPEYGTVYNLGSPADLMAMTERENMLISMPHPNSKRSTGYPEAIKDSAQFLHPNYFSLGFRWGMGIDASETRLSEYRFLHLWNDVNNWMAERNLAPKFALAISEARSDKGERGKPPYDDAYGMSPVNYVKLEEVPNVDNMRPLIETLRQGDYFVTTGEILIPSYAVEFTETTATINAQVEWTFPLDFVEVVWGDGQQTGRKIIPATDLSPFGSKAFKIPVEIGEKKWLRFAVWDVAGNGALVQPVSLPELTDQK